MARSSELASYLYEVLRNNQDESSGLDTGYVHSYQVALTTDTTQTLTATTQSLTGEITSGNLAQSPYTNSAGVQSVNSTAFAPLTVQVYGSFASYADDGYTINSAPVANSLTNLDFIEISIVGMSAASITIRRAIIRSSNGKMRYIFDLPIPLVLTNGRAFRIDFRHYLAGANGWSG